MPQGNHSTESKLKNKQLDGWQEIRQAVRTVETLIRSGYPEANVRIVEVSPTSSLRVTVGSIKELDVYLASHMRKTILGKEVTEGHEGASNGYSVKGKIIL